MNRDLEIARLKKDWSDHPRWKGVQRPYSAEDVYRLRGTLAIEYTLARHGAEKLWQLLKHEPFVNALGALTGNQALQQVKAGLKAIYLSGWQVAADANLSGEMYPDQSLYPANSVPAVVRRINNTFIRADQIHHAEGKDDIDWFAPVVADAEGLREMAFDVLVKQLGHRPSEASQLIADAFRRRPGILTAEDLFNEIYRAAAASRRS